MAAMQFMIIWTIIAEGLLNWIRTKFFIKTNILVFFEVKKEKLYENT
jgi:hypothetical protein